VELDSLPLATCVAVVDRVTAELQAPEDPPLTLLQVAFTAEVGTVAQLVNDEAAACTLRFHVLLLEPPEVVQLTVAEELPETVPESGLIDVKVIVLGVALTVPRPVTAGIIALAVPTYRRCFCSADSSWTAPRQKQIARSADCEPVMPR
jgi:hypothetical protein